MNDSKLEWTGERYLPEIGGTIALEHLHRYLVAKELAKDKDVIDIACGEGYGSAMLAEVAHHVSGVDISEEAVAHASKKYQKNNLHYLVGSCASIPLPDNSVDLVVSFETIEHHDQHQKMMLEIKRVLRPDGVLIISSPDKHEFTNIRQQGTHYHVKELYRDEFEELIGNNFLKSAFIGQRVIYGSVILSEKLSLKSKTYFQNDKSLAGTTGLECPLYIIAVASDEDIPEFSNSVLEKPVHESDAVRQIYDECVHLHYKIGERDVAIEALQHKIGERDVKIEELQHKVDMSNEVIPQLNHKIVECEVLVELLNEKTTADLAIIGALDKEKKMNEEKIEALNIELDGILRSRSWRITAPLRAVKRKLID